MRLRPWISIGSLTLSRVFDGAGQIVARADPDGRLEAPAGLSDDAEIGYVWSVANYGVYPASQVGFATQAANTLSALDELLDQNEGPMDDMLFPGQTLYQAVSIDLKRHQQMYTGEDDLYVGMRIIYADMDDNLRGVEAVIKIGPSINRTIRRRTFDFPRQASQC